MRFQSKAPVTCALCDARISRTELSRSGQWRKVKKGDNLSFCQLQLVASNDGMICYTCYKRRLDEQHEASEQPSTRNRIAPPPPRPYKNMKLDEGENLDPNVEQEEEEERQGRVLDCITPEQDPPRGAAGGGNPAPRAMRGVNFKSVMSFGSEIDDDDDDDDDDDVSDIDDEDDTVEASHLQGINLRPVRDPPMRRNKTEQINRANEVFEEMGYKKDHNGQSNLDWVRKTMKTDPQLLADMLKHLKCSLETIEMLQEKSRLFDLAAEEMAKDGQENLIELLAIAYLSGRAGPRHLIWDQVRITLRNIFAKNLHGHRFDGRGGDAVLANAAISSVACSGKRALAQYRAAYCFSIPSLKSCMRLLEFASPNKSNAGINDAAIVEAVAQANAHRAASGAPIYTKDNPLQLTLAFDATQLREKVWIQPSDRRIQGAEEGGQDTKLATDLGLSSTRDLQKEANELGGLIDSNQNDDGLSPVSMDKFKAFFDGKKLFLEEKEQALAARRVALETRYASRNNGGNPHHKQRNVLALVQRRIDSVKNASNSCDAATAVLSRPIGSIDLDCLASCLEKVTIEAATAATDFLEVMAQSPDNAVVVSVARMYFNKSTKFNYRVLLSALVSRVNDSTDGCAIVKCFSFDGEHRLLRKGTPESMTSEARAAAIEQIGIPEGRGLVNKARFIVAATNAAIRYMLGNGKGAARCQPPTQKLAGLWKPPARTEPSPPQPGATSQPEPAGPPPVITNGVDGLEGARANIGLLLDPALQNRIDAIYQHVPGGQITPFIEGRDYLDQDGVADASLLPAEAQDETRGGTVFLTHQQKKLLAALEHARNDAKAWLEYQNEQDSAMKEGKRGLSKHRVNELRELCEARGLDAGGTKADLVARLSAIALAAPDEEISKLARLDRLPPRLECPITPEKLKRLVANQQLIEMTRESKSKGRYYDADDNNAIVTLDQDHIFHNLVTKAIGLAGQVPTGALVNIDKIEAAAEEINQSSTVAICRGQCDKHSHACTLSVVDNPQLWAQLHKGGHHMEATVLEVLGRAWGACRRPNHAPGERTRAFHIIKILVHRVLGAHMEDVTSLHASCERGVLVKQLLDLLSNADARTARLEALDKHDRSAYKESADSTRHVESSFSALVTDGEKPTADVIQGRVVHLEGAQYLKRKYRGSFEVIGTKRKRKLDPVGDSGTWNVYDAAKTAAWYKDNAKRVKGYIVGRASSARDNAKKHARS